MMERHGYYIIYFNGSEVKIRYHYKFQVSNLRVTFEGRNLADLLDITQQRTLKDRHFEAYMEISIFEFSEKLFTKVHTCSTQLLVQVTK